MRARRTAGWAWLTEGCCARQLSLAAEDKVWREFSSQQPAVHSLLGGALTVIDPALYTDTSAKVVNEWLGATLSSSFITYSPCLIFNFPYGFGLNAFGASIQPTGIFIVPIGFNGVPQGLNVAPTLIYVGPLGRNIQATGFNVVPALIAVAPVYEAQQVIGKNLSSRVLGTQVILPRERP